MNGWPNWDSNGFGLQVKILLRICAYVCAALWKKSGPRWNSGNLRGSLLIGWRLAMGIAIWKLLVIHW